MVHSTTPPRIRTLLIVLLCICISSHLVSGRRVRLDSAASSILLHLHLMRTSNNHPSFHPSSQLFPSWFIARHVVHPGRRARSHRHMVCSVCFLLLYLSLSVSSVLLYFSAVLGSQFPVPASSSSPHCILVPRVHIARCRVCPSPTCPYRTVPLDLIHPLIRPFREHRRRTLLTPRRWPAARRVQSQGPPVREVL